MLKQRIITALVLLLFLLPALFHHDTLYWRLIALVLITAGAWEWAPATSGPRRVSLHAKRGSEPAQSALLCNGRARQRRT